MPKRSLGAPLYVNMFNHILRQPLTLVHRSLQLPLTLVHCCLRLPLVVLRLILCLPLAALGRLPQPLADLDGILVSALAILDDILAWELLALDSILAWPLTLLNSILTWALNGVQACVPGLELSVPDGILGMAPGLLDAEHSFLQVDEDTARNDTAAAANQAEMKQSILRIARSMKSHTSQPFIVVGGASLILYGSDRTTADVDFLISKASLVEFTVAKARILEHPVGQGPTQGSNITSIDLLHDLHHRFRQVDLQSLKPYMEVLEGIPVLKLEVLLCAKFTSHFERPEGEAGDEKRKTDLRDILWISREMKNRHLNISTEVRNLFVCGPYHMLLVLVSLYYDSGEKGVELFESVGGRELECDWGAVEFAEQAELYGIELELGEYTEEELKILRSRKNPDPLP